MPIAAPPISFRVPESFVGQPRRELGALARYRIARLERELQVGGPWVVELARTADGFACRVSGNLGEGAGAAERALDALEDAVSQLEMRLRIALGEPAPHHALAG